MRAWVLMCVTSEDCNKCVTAWLILLPLGTAFPGDVLMIQTDGPCIFVGVSVYLHVCVLYSCTARSAFLHCPDFMY